MIIDAPDSKHNTVLTLGKITVRIRDELLPLVDPTSHAKKSHAPMHIGRHVTDAEWLEVIDARKQLKAEQERRIAIRKERSRRRPKPWINTRERLTDKQELEAAKIETQKELDFIRDTLRHKKEVRQALLRTARIARNMGFAVKSSKDDKGRVSSYYATRNNSRPVRISDHSLPASPKRDFYAEHYGSSAFAGELLVTGPLSITRIKRLLILAEAGRI